MTCHLGILFYKFLVYSWKLNLLFAFESAQDTEAIAITGKVTS